MLCFLYNYHYLSKQNSHRGLWSIVTTSPQRKNSVVAFWGSFHSSLWQFFGESAVLYFFEVTGMHLNVLVLLSDTVIYLQLLKQRQFLSFVPNILTWWQHTTLCTSESIELHHRTIDIFKKMLIFQSNKIYFLYWLHISCISIIAENTNWIIYNAFKV